MAASPKGMPDAERDEIVRAYALPGAAHGAMGSRRTPIPTGMALSR